jgi:hypothetical protein
MRRANWGKALLMAAGLGVAAVGSVQAQQAKPSDPAQVVVIREPGKPEQRCVIEYAMPQQDGRTIYYVRDIATGERLRVVDSRTSKNASGPIVGKVIGRLNGPGDTGMSQALASSPTREAGTHRTPTTAELAGSPTKSNFASKPKLVVPPRDKPSGPAIGEEQSPVEVQLTQLREAIGPSQRESAAMVLAVSEARTMPEVVKAIMSAARHDPAPSVRTTCVRCLYRLSSEVADVVPIIAECRADQNAEVAATASLAMEEIGKRTEVKKN